ncbi:polyprenyl diphosphate synthase [Alphaproteobacteria bacterium]|nr:polyprenyl diphosphate synthase [Alphaproteobacteria bacterium]
MKLNHLAIIMDGNRRWAISNNLPSYHGHQKGADNLWNMINDIDNYSFKYLTVFIFSTENWKRSKKEISFLMELLNKFLDDTISKIKNENIKIRFIGDLSVFNKKIQNKLHFIMNETLNNTGVTVSLALNYGGRSDIIAALNKVLKNNSISEIFIENDFKKFTSNGDLPYPDLLIRTGGEKRLSNFLLWDLAYTELMFLDKMWPDFNKITLDKCIHNFNKRVRNYGV